VSSDQLKPSEARAPAYGLRVEFRNDSVLLRTLDGSGRGTPLEAVFVPVVQEGDRLRIDDRSTFAATPSSFKPYLPAGAHVSPSTQKKPVLSKGPVAKEEAPVAPRLFEVPRLEWPDGELILVLLLYDQSEGIGGTPRRPRTTDTNSTLIDLVKEALDCDSMSELRGGLIRQRPATQATTVGPNAEKHVRFAVASCQYPSDIFNRMPGGENATHGPADASLLALSKLLNQQPDPPTLLLMCGDQVYTDATAGLFDPKVSDQRFRIPHERRGQSRGSMAVMQRLDLAVEMIPDDHEIRDNWAPNDPESGKPGTGNTILELGKSAYLTYERGLDVDPLDVLHTEVWHTIEHKGLRFFLGDTRTERGGRTMLNWRDARIMDQKQFETLCEWLVAPCHADRPKFVLTASALLPRRRRVAEHPAHALHSEGWEGYPASMLALLKFICDNEVRGVVFLSGDDHLSNLVTATVTSDEEQRRCTLYSIHSSGLYSPYPFANGVTAEFMGDESFYFPDPASPRKLYRCDVQTKFARCDGFAVLTARGGQSSWSLDVDFHNADGVKNNGTFHGLPL
jgi:hypothetical protein